MLLPPYTFQFVIFLALDTCFLDTSCMTTLDKLTILSDAAKYDVSCSSSGSERTAPAGGLGAAKHSGICHTFTSDGRCVSLLKILLSNVCVYDCAYCVNRVSNDIPRATFRPEEVAELTINFYRRNYIEGLFLSSGVIDTPDMTMEKIIRVLELLRHQHRYGGYIHVKLIPGASETLTIKASLLADRVSANLELPSEKSLQLLAPDKAKSAVLAPLKQIAHFNYEHLPQDPKRGQGKRAIGMSTQMIIGATPESDREILHLSQNLYDKALLKRVYYSAYIPINESRHLPALNSVPPLLREHRLYQADWLLRFYGFEAQELLSADKPNLDTRFDPKTVWALRHLEHFPIEINHACKEELIRIPGIGIRSAHKILAARRYRALDEEALKALGVQLKRARLFITAKGRYLGRVRFDGDILEQSLLQQRSNTPKPIQPTLFQEEHFHHTVKGEL